MGNPARQVTDSRGMRPFSNGLYHAEMCAQPLSQTKVDVWDVAVHFGESAGAGITLHDLTTKDCYAKYNLLAHHIMRQYGNGPETQVWFGFTLGLKAIRVFRKKIEYRQRGTKIWVAEVS